MQKRVKRILVQVAIVLLLMVIGATVAYAVTMPRRAPELTFTADTDKTVEPMSHMHYSQEYLTRLRTQFSLDEVVAGTNNDLERVRAIASWVNGLWKHDGTNQPEYSDPIYILEQVAQGERFRCTEYGLVIAGCLQALGIPARPLGLMTSDVETRSSGAGHVVTEAYLSDLDKWVFIDGQWNVIPLLKGVPLNAIELQEALAQGKGGLELTGIDSLRGYFYRWWVAPYLYYFNVPYHSQRLFLGPEDASAPQVFQGRFPIGDILYIHSPRHFYLPPACGE